MCHTMSFLYLSLIEFDDSKARKKCDKDVVYFRDATFFPAALGLFSPFIQFTFSQAIIKRTSVVRRLRRRKLLQCCIIVLNFHTLWSEEHKNFDPKSSLGLNVSTMLPMLLCPPARQQSFCAIINIIDFERRMQDKEKEENFPLIFQDTSSSHLSFVCYVPVGNVFYSSDQISPINFSPLCHKQGIPSHLSTVSLFYGKLGQEKQTV